MVAGLHVTLHSEHWQSKQTRLYGDKRDTGYSVSCTSGYVSGSILMIFIAPLEWLWLLPNSHNIRSYR